MKCPKCHTDNPDSSRFCGSCAAPLVQEGQPSVSLTKTLETPVHGLAKGSIVAGKYRIVEEIGRGGMGVVYKAEDIKLTRTVALKFLPHQWTSDPDARERFVQEARAASAQDHPNICNIHEIEETEDGRMYIAMAYYEGESLRDKIKRGPLKKEEALDIILQAVRGMAKAHQKGIIHRDLKPANILVTDEGVAKVVDFGLAKLAGQIKLTREGTTVGTVAYMSPEQAKGETIDQRTDTWSLGVVLYEMLSGRLPFKGEYEQSLIHSILNHDPEPITRIRKDIPRELDQVLGKALEKRAVDRYQDMAEFLGDLEAIAEGLRPLKAKAHPLRGRIFGIRKIYAYAGLAGLAILVALALIGPLRKHVQAYDSIAVMPLENLSGDPEQDSLTESIHDELITNLAGLSSLKTVIARSTVMTYKGKNIPPQKIAQELNVNCLITGALRLAGERVRVTAQLIDPATGAQVWAHGYERDVRDVVSLENEIVAAIAREVNLQLTPQEKSRLESARPVDPEAYAAYTKGRFYLNKSTPEEYEKGLNYMQQAIDKDPTNPLPYAALALGYCLIGHGTAPPPDAFARAKAAALKAEELGGTLAETEAALGQIKLFEEWDWAGAEKGLRHAMALNPSLPEAQRMYSWYLLLIGHGDEAIATMRRAIEVDPLNPFWCSDLAWQFWTLGRNQEAMEAVEKSLELDPNFNQALCWQGFLYSEKGMFEEAIAAHQKLAALSRPWRWALVRTYAQAGRKDEAMKLLTEYLGQRKARGRWEGWFLGEIYAALGDKDEAFQWLEAAVNERMTFIPWMRQNPAYEPLRSDPRFQDLVRRMKLPELE
ncbi:MAG: protein kinase [Candidatus Aminicenantes bacterium]|nr:protein kinase [Candidatus Aminicenantes bacterium]